MWAWARRIFNALLGGGTTTEKIAEIADESVHTNEEKAVEDAAGVDKARAFSLAPSHASWFDVFVDGVNRLIRPTIIYYTFFGIIGLYPLPDIQQMNPYWWTVFERILYFVFGVRFVSQDLPKLIASIVAAKGKRP